MGGAFYAASDDEMAVHYNPAGLSRYSGGAQFMMGTGVGFSEGTLSSLSFLGSSLTSLMGGTGGTGATTTLVSGLLGLSGKPVYLGLGVTPYFITRGLSFSLLLGDTKIQTGLLGNGLDINADTTVLVDNGVVVGLSRQFAGDKVAVGVSAKGLYRVGGHKVLTTADLVSNQGLTLGSLGGAGGGLEFDVGVLFKLPSKTPTWEWSAGVAVNNALATEFASYRLVGPPPQLPRTVSLGLQGLYRGLKSVPYVRLLADFADVQLGGQAESDLGARSGSLTKHINCGVEIPLTRLITVRGGLHQGNWTAGLGLELYLFKLTFATYGEELLDGVGRMSSRRYSLQLSLGFGASGAGPASAKSAPPASAPKA